MGRRLPPVSLLFAVSLLTPARAAQTLGDIDQDGVATVRDIAMIAGHCNGTATLSEVQRQYADVNNDGVINDVDMDELVKEILGTRQPETLPLATIRSVSPASGEGDVAVTRETVIHFTIPLGSSAALDTTKFRAEFGGKKILSRVELSSDRKKASLFYLEPLPSNARVQVSFDGSGLTDLIGRPLDADGDGIAGGTWIGSFDTLSISPVLATAVSGRVFASQRGTGGGELPLAGVTVTVDGAEQTLRTVTDAQGNFTLSPCPAGSFFVHVDGRTSPQSSYPNGSYYPFVGKRWEADAGRANNLCGNSQDTSRGTVYLPLIASGTMQLTSQSQETKVDFPAAILAANPQLAGTEIAVPPNSLFSDNGVRGGRVGIAPVAPDRLPSPLPPGLNLPLVITIQTDGASNFDRPVPVTFPNLPDPITGQKLAPGAKSALWSFNHDLGDWEIVGPMTVSEDGMFVKTDAGVGVLQPGWHGTQPGTQMSGGEALEPKSDCYPGSATAKAAFSAMADCAMEFGEVRNWLKCSLSVTNLVSDSVDFFTRKKDPPTQLNRAKEYSDAIGLLAGGLEVIKECGTAGVATASPISKLSATLTCSGGAASTLSTYLEEVPEHCSNATFRKVVDGVDGILGLANAASGLKDAIEEYDPHKLDNVLDLDIAVIDAEKSAIDAIITAIESAQPNNPTAPLQPEQAAAVAQAAVDAQAASARAQGMVSSMSALDKDLQGVQQSIVSGLQESGNAMRQSGKAPSAMPAGTTDVKVTFYPDGREGSPVVIHPKSGPGGSMTFTGPPDIPYVVETYNRDTGHYDRSNGFTSGNGSRTDVPPVTYRPPTGRPPLVDRDGDGLPDVQEGILGTNPLDPDSDGDGISDGAEVRQGTNPLDSLPASTGVIASAPAVGYSQDVAALNNIAVTANGEQGITLFNVLSGTNPVRLQQIDTPGIAVAVALSADRVAVADYSAGLAIVNISTPATPVISHQVSLGSQATCVATYGPLACVGLQDGAIAAVDLVTGVVLWRKTSTNGSLQDLCIVGQTLYAYRVGRVEAIALDDATHPITGFVVLSGGVGAGARRLRISAGPGVLYASNTAGWAVLDIASNPFSPSIVSQRSTGQFGFKQLVSTGSSLAVAAASPNSTNDGPHDLDLYNSGADGRGGTFLTTLVTPGLAEAVSIYNGLAYVADGASGLQVVNYRSYDSLGQAPSILLSSNFNLAAGAAEEGSLMRLSAQVTDDVQVRNVEFYVDGALVLIDGNFPFEHRFVTPAIAAGKTNFKVRARAVDTGGNATWSDEFVLTLVPDATPPQAMAFYPSNTALTGGINLITVTFSEPMDVGSLSGGVSLTAAGADGSFGTADDAVITPESLNFALESKTAYFNLSSALLPGLYRIRAAAPASDAAGNAMNAPANSQFRVFSMTDSDGDGVPDDWEPVLGLNPSKADSNNNGVPDGMEDFDNDGLKNAYELVMKTDPRIKDTNGNGIDDGNEDNDGDGLKDSAEFAKGTDPNKVDSDGDGYDDASEIADGTDPLSATSRPALGVYTQSLVYLNAVSDPLPPGVEAVTTPAIVFLNAVGETLPPDVEAITSPMVIFLNAVSAESPPPSAVSPTVIFLNQSPP